MDKILFKVTATSVGFSGGGTSGDREERKEGVRKVLGHKWAWVWVEGDKEGRRAYAFSRGCRV